MLEGVQDWFNTWWMVRCYVAGADVSHAGCLKSSLYVVSDGLQSDREACTYCAHTGTVFSHTGTIFSPTEQYAICNTGTNCALFSTTCCHTDTYAHHLPDTHSHTIFYIRMTINFNTTSSWQHFGPALGTSGLLDFVLLASAAQVV